uniref:YEATS domain-containing protein n=1 Tax=Ciona intestinalis TaxID=7719 RepID=F6VS86_CIOIN
MVTAIVVKLELGHIAKARDLPTFSGHTHDWMVFVKGAEGTDIAHFVEKVVFWLHESYNPPKCVVKQPPYEVRQTGYAGFKILIDIHFKNKSEPKSVQFQYNMFLHMENMPPVNHTRVEMLTFTNPAEDFRSKLLCAGGVLKNQDSLDVQPKEKKSSKESRYGEESHKSGHKSKEKSSVKNEKSKVKHSKKEDKRRNSIDENEFVRKRKEDSKPKPSSSTVSNTDKKSKEKVNKLKIKVEQSAGPGLFSREESINMKQIKKKDKKEDIKIEKEKRFTPEHKIKKEAKEHSDKTTENTKHKKISPEKSKQKRSSDFKVKKRRTMSSSGSDMDIPRQTVTPPVRSDQDLKDERTIKRHKKDKLKELKKSEKKSKRSSTPQRERKVSPLPLPQVYSSNTSVDMEISKTPPRGNMNQSLKSSKSSSSHQTKKQKTSKASENTRVTSSGVKIHIKDVKKKRSPEALRRKDTSSSSSSLSPVPSPIHSVPNLLLPLPKEDDDSNSDSMEDFNTASPIHQPPARENKNVHEGQSPMSSDSDEAVFHNSPLRYYNNEESESHDEEKRFPPEPAKKRRDSVGLERKFPVVTVGVGKELRTYPGLTQEMFEKLRELQSVIAAVTDQNRLKEILSIVRNSGNFSMVGGAVDFDLCSLDRKTIHKIQKHLKVS